MARLFDGSADSGQATFDLSGSNKLTLAFWLYQNAFDNGDGMAFEYTATVASNAGAFAVDPNSSLGGAFGMFISGAGVGSYTSRTFPRPSAAAWHHYVLHFDGSVSGSSMLPAAYLDGASQTLTDRSTTGTTGNFANSTLNFMARNGGASLKNAGRIAEVAIWPGVLLSAAEAQILAYGYSPRLVRPASLGYYWPLRSPEQSTEPELVAAKGVALVGTIDTPHPTALYPSPLSIALNPAGTGTHFRKTFSGLGTRTGSRQLIGV